ncbi:hypothetical protein TrLO_g7662 [Triparma laevis f. longispina]|uniref:Uncharacterized protein n=1 Tax=Triparma laevis f. longispina TaxID=1714387 RepID=A0A9W6ZK28_9STRA|nr:hypothetical protein TrLO_g7662 [Triparma laevis f. longispina]
MSKIDTTGDLVLLRTISEDTIVSSLQSRYKSDKIYTYIGTGQVLLCVNPFKMINKLYAPATLNKYKNRRPYENPPHVYAIAEKAYKDLKETHRPQCVLVSGESGAGKTENAKKLMEYITNVAGTSETNSADGIKDKILRSNVLLESFGNAKTLRNDNSSRFGKLMEILFDYGGSITGGRVTSYLLEKIRVTQPKEGERNFHIFYQLCAACSRGEYEELGLGTPDCYSYLLRSGCFKVPRINDLNEFHDTDQAMDAIGFTQDEKTSAFKVCAAILNLGNVQFVDAGAEGSDIDPASNDSVGWVAFHLCMDEGVLRHNLTHRKIDVNGEEFQKPLLPADAFRSRDALAMSLYSNAFSDIVTKLNASLESSGNKFSRVGILDIYGFEIFDDNSMEQLHINYCNEKLQQLFIELTLRAEQNEYAKEGIKWETVNYFDNEPVVKLIESKRPIGLLTLLDEESVMPRATDETFAVKCEKHIQNKHYVPMGRTHFQIKHYAGAVTYMNAGMLEKNKDQLNKNLVEMLQTDVQNEYIKSLYPVQAKSFKKPPTVSTQFKKQMNELMENLSQCNAHYVRTIKPNDQKRAGVYESEMVKNQVTYLGLKENVVVRRAGYAVRQKYEEFFQRYRLLSEDVWPFGTGDVMADCESILRAINITSGYEKGKSMIFLREPTTLFALEDARDAKLNMVAAKIQGCYRAWIAIKYFLELRRKADAVFGGKKRRAGSVHLNFHGDYLDCRSSLSLSTALTEVGEYISDIKYADRVDKINRKGVVQERLLVITSNAFYFFTPDMEKAAMKSTNPLNCLLGMSLSSFADGYCVLHFTDHDYVINSRRKAEIVMVLKERYMTLLENELPLDFSDRIEYKTWGGGMFRSKSITMNYITFEEDRGLVDNEVQFMMAKDAQNTMKVKVPSNLASRAPIGLNDGTPSRGVAAAVSSYVAPVKNTYAKPGYGGGGGGGGGGGAGPPKNPYSSYISKTPAAVSAPAPAAAAPPAWASANNNNNNNQPGERKSLAKSVPRPPPKKAFQPPPPPKTQALVLYDYEAADEGELTIKEGQEVSILKENEDGWWMGKGPGGEKGLFPGNYVKKL